MEEESPRFPSGIRSRHVWTTKTCNSALKFLVVGTSFQHLFNIDFSRTSNDEGSFSRFFCNYYCDASTFLICETCKLPFGKKPWIPFEISQAMYRSSSGSLIRLLLSRGITNGVRIPLMRRPDTSALLNPPLPPYSNICVGLKFDSQKSTQAIRWGYCLHFSTRRRYRMALQKHLLL